MTAVCMYRYMYLQIIYNFCYAAALVGLIHFWAGTKELLKPYKPVWKFVTVKGVVFVTFWQGLLISLLLINRPQESANQLQTWLLCIQMVPAAIMMWFAFPASPYMNAARSREQGGILMAVQNVGNVVMFTDVVTDLKHQVSSLGKLLVFGAHWTVILLVSIMQFKPQYNTYTCYRDMDSEDHLAPTGQYRHATYIIRDPYQEQAIAAGKAQPGANGQVRVACQDGWLMYSS
jgi:hypothetical protein